MISKKFTANGLPVCVYESEDFMGRTTAERIATRQVGLAGKQDTVAIHVMAAPSAFEFYAAYVEMAETSSVIQNALAKTHFFQFDDYPLPPDHPASFCRLLDTHLYSKLERWCPEENFHRLRVDGPDPDDACAAYCKELLALGPDLQVKGMGENGHWGFHEPGIPLDGDPAYIRVPLSPENAAQQCRDHPELFTTPEDVPKEAYTANVPLFLKTRVSIEDDVPHASKAFALLAAYGSDVVDAAVPSSALKGCKHAMVHATKESVWALEKYIHEGAIDDEDIEKMAEALGGEGKIEASIRGILETMKIKVG